MNNGERARRVINQLKGQGFPIKLQAQRSGYSNSLFVKVRGGATCSDDALAAIEGLPLVLKPGDRLERTSYWGTMRRMQALRAMGYTIEFLEEFTTLENETLRRASRQPQLWRSTAKIIDDAYRELTENPRVDKLNIRAKVYAESRGWVPPEAWHGRDMDDKHARPDW